MTDIATTRIDDRRLELLRRQLSPAVAATGGRDGDLSDGQRRMWRLQSLDRDSAMLNVCASYRITGPVDTDRLHRAVAAVAERHAVLRTTYQADGDSEARPATDQELRPAWAEHDLTELAEQPQRLRLEVLAQRAFSRPFDLSSESPLRITAVRVGPEELVLLIAAHHIAWDDGSWAPFFADLTRAYGDLDALDGPLPAAIGPSEVTGGVDEELDYWQQLMADLPEPLELPGANGSAAPTDRRARRATVHLPAATFEQVTALARETGVTPYLVLLAAFGALIHRYTHAADFLVAAPVSNRGPDAAEAIGYYDNTVVVRMRPHRRQTFRQLVQDTAGTAEGAFAYQRVSLDWLVREADPDHSDGAERTTRIGFGLRQPDGDGFCPAGVRCERYELRGQFSQLPLEVIVQPDDGGAVVEAEYLVEVLDQPLVHQLLDHYAVLLEHALAEPDTTLAELPLMRSSDLDWIREAASGEEFSTPATTLAALFTKQAKATPDAVAVVYEDRRYSYRELNEQANRLAHWLIEQGVGTEDRVGVLLDKSAELVIMALGILKAGAVYLPIDPTYPEDRLSFILDDSDPKTVLREMPAGLDRCSSADPAADELVRPLHPDNIAYLIYTSGSTGLPKGVPVPHAPIAEYFVWFRDEYQVDEDDRLLQVASPSFDASIAEIFGTLTCGARLVIPRPDGLRDIGYLSALLEREGITSMHFVPSLLGLFLSLPGVNQWRTLRRVPIGGEPLPGEIADKFHATFDALLYNFYGPTETVVNATSYQVEGSQGNRIVPIGKPKINTQLHLLDDALQPVPVDVIGEIYIGGTHMAHGYHRRPGLTAERFVADPFRPGGRLYRSGDLARRNADGDIEFVGRADEQVKIRGFRIELGEVASAISVDPSVGQAVVVAIELPQLGKSLVGYLTAAEGGVESVDVDRIRARVAAALPDYMTPAAYVVLDEIPVTTHGKIDRDALPHPEIAPVTEYREPNTDTERRIARLFAGLLGHDRVGADDSFFDLGGHSLVATKLAAALRSECGVEVGVRDIFDLVTVARLAERVDELAADPAAVRRPKLVATSHDEPMPLSASQLRTWFTYRIDGPSPVNNIPFAARLGGPCDVDALVAAVSDLTARHEILRTTYTEIDGVPHQVVNAAADVSVRRDSGEGEEWLADQLDSERRGDFDLEHDWPIRAAVLQMGSGTSQAHVISLVVHHIAIDHWSGGVLFGDLLTAYRARRARQEPSWAPLPLQYADYAAWQAELLADDGSVADAQRDYWVHQLDGLPEDTGLRPDFPRQPVPSDAGDSVEFTIDAQTRGKLAALCRELGITEFMLLQSAVAVVLHKAGSGVDIPIGTPVAARGESELDQLIGFFINILVLRNDLAENPTLREVLGRIRETALAAYANQDLPFDRVVDAVSPTRSLARNPLFQVVVHVRDHLPAARAIDSGPDGDTVSTALEPTFDIAHADLSFNFFTTEDPGDIGYTGNALYRTELYRRSTIERVVGWLTQVIETFADDVDRRLRDVQLIDAAERQRILAQSRGEQPPVDRALTIPDLLEPSRQCGADRIAVRCGDEQIDFPTLHRRSDNFGRLLAERGVGPGSLVGLSTRRSVDMVVALVGIMKAGAGFFPLDPAYPTPRKQFTLDDVAPRVVVVTTEALETMPEQADVELLSLDDPAIQDAMNDQATDGSDHPLPKPHPEDPMYLVFTSGSTGTPKGVLGTQRAMTSRLNWQLWHYPVAGNDIRLAQASMTFLEGCMETLAGLAAGATTILADDAEHRDAEALAQLIQRHSVAQVTAVPSLVSTIVDAPPQAGGAPRPDALAGLTRLVCGAEPLTVSLQERLLAAYGQGDGPELLNNFGATETSGALVRGPMTPPVPLLGTPMPDAQVYLLDDGLNPVPAGVVGELYYAGGQLARGYWKRPGLTAARFLPNPFASEPGARLYRSGDRARWTEDGRLEFVGRTDDQVKVRGFRVELGEVEAALRAAGGVAVAAARSWDVQGSTTLAGYVVPHDALADDSAKSEFAAAVRAEVVAALPGYMVPSSITVLDAMPKTESGKLNRLGLPQPAASTTGKSKPPETDTERALAEVFAELLSTSEVGRFDDFFALGGDSILSVQVAARARAAGLAVSPRMVFEKPTVQLLGAAVDAAPSEESTDGAAGQQDKQHQPMSVSGLSADDLAAATSSWQSRENKS